MCNACIQPIRLVQSLPERVFPKLSCGFYYTVVFLFFFFFLLACQSVAKLELLLYAWVDHPELLIESSSKIHQQGLVTTVGDVTP